MAFKRFLHVVHFLMNLRFSWRWEWILPGVYSNVNLKLTQTWERLHTIRTTMPPISSFIYINPENRIEF
jgi:muconolactone delta-isomerase